MINILNDVIKGASSQFGREFGRAGANLILNGKNHYSVKNTDDYSGRIKPSDSDIIKALKKINKINFASTDKANVSRLIELTDLVPNEMVFKGLETLNQISDINKLVDNYNDKFEHGSVLVSDDFQDKSLEFLKQKRQAYLKLIEEFNLEIKTHINNNLEKALKKRKSKKVATILSCPFLIVGCLGIHKFYLNQIGYGILYFILCTSLSPFLSLINFIQFLLMSQERFDNKYNPEFSYYSQFTIDNN